MKQRFEDVYSHPYFESLTTLQKKFVYKVILFDKFDELKLFELEILEEIEVKLGLIMGVFNTSSV